MLKPLDIHGTCCACGRTDLPGRVIPRAGERDDFVCVRCACERCGGEMHWHCGLRADVGTCWHCGATVFYDKYPYDDAKGNLPPAPPTTPVPDGKEQ